MLENATMLDNNFMLNEAGYKLSLTDKEEKNLFKDYYLKTCEFINRNHFTNPNIDTIESVLDGRHIPVDKINSIICSIDSTDLRKYLFKMAMAKQIIYDLENGRVTMQRTDQTYNVCPEFNSNLSFLGFVQTGKYSRVGK